MTRFSRKLTWHLVEAFNIYYSRFIHRHAPSDRKYITNTLSLNVSSILSIDTHIHYIVTHEYIYIYIYISKWQRYSTNWNITLWQTIRGYYLEYGILLLTHHNLLHQIVSFRFLLWGLEKNWLCYKSRSLSLAAPTAVCILWLDN